MKSVLNKAVALSAALAATSNLNAQIILDTGDTDIGIAYEDGWDLHVHKEEPPDDSEYEPADALLQINSQAQTTVPAGAPWSFLGSAGSPVWILPNSPNEDLLFLGFATEEIADGVFENNEVTLSLRGVTGPGDFSAYSVIFGSPSVLMNSADGFTGPDSVVLPTGTHQHFNLAFTAPGDYTITFEGMGTLVAGSQLTQSGPVDYFFTVVPEPSTAALTGVGIATLFASRRKNSARVTQLNGRCSLDPSSRQSLSKHKTEHR